MSHLKKLLSEYGPTVPLCVIMGLIGHHAGTWAGESIRSLLGKDRELEEIMLFREEVAKRREEVTRKFNAQFYPAEAESKEGILTKE